MKIFRVYFLEDEYTEVGCHDFEVEREEDLYDITCKYVDDVLSKNGLVVAGAKWREIKK